MEHNWKFGNWFTAGCKFAPEKNYAHGSIQRWVHERQTMLWMGDSQHQLFPHVLLPLGLSLPVFAVWPSTLSPSHHLTRQTQQVGKPPGRWICPMVSEGDKPPLLSCLCEMQGIHQGNPTTGTWLHCGPFALTSQERCSCHSPPTLPKARHGMLSATENNKIRSEKTRSSTSSSPSFSLSESTDFKGQNTALKYS